MAVDEREAALHYRVAAKDGWAVAQGALGYCYAYGLGVSQDKGAATRWCRKAIEQGDADAKYYLGSLMTESDSGPHSKERMDEATSLIREAASAGVEEAQEWLENRVRTQ